MELFENVLDKAKDLMGIAGKKAGEVVETSKLKVSSLQINSEIKDCYEKLGSAVYSMMKAGYENPELIASITAEIDQLFERLEDNNAKISLLKNVAMCDCCGTKNPVDAVYCAKCGNKLVKEQTSAGCTCHCADCSNEQLDTEA